VPQLAVVDAPGATGIAPAGTAAGAAGSTESAPATAALTCRAAYAPEPRLRAPTSCWIKRVSPLTSARVVPRARPRDWCAFLTPTAVSRRAPAERVAEGGTSPGTAAADETGAVLLAPSNAVVIIETRADGKTVAVTDVAPAAPTRYQADSRSPFAPLTAS
jgi:hypothetical protein